MAPSAISSSCTTEVARSRVGSVSSVNKTHGTHIFPHGGGAGNELIGDALKSRIEAIDTDHCQAGDEDPFFVADLGEVFRQHVRWKLNLPRVKPFYGEFS